MTTKEYFPGIGKIQFEGKESKNPLAFRYYEALFFMKPYLLEDI